MTSTCTLDISRFAESWWSQAWLDRPSFVDVPSSFTRTVGKEPSGTLSVLLNRLRANDLFGGEELRICVDDVGTGVGKDSFPSNKSRDLFRVFGKTGDEDNGSNAGRRDAAAFFVPILPGSASFRGESSSISLSCGKS